jgi:hypothetical protein
MQSRRDTVLATFDFLFAANQEPAIRLLTCSSVKQQDLSVAGTTAASTMQKR